MSLIYHQTSQEIPTLTLAQDIHQVRSLTWFKNTHCLGLLYWGRTI